MNYPAPRWLPGGHLQTIYPATSSPSRRRLPARALGAPDGDFIDVDFVDGEPRQAVAGAVPRPGRLVRQPLRARADGARGARLALRGAAFSRLLGRAQPGAARLPLRRLRGGRLDPARACARAHAGRSLSRSASRSAAMRCCAGWAKPATSAAIVDARPARFRRRSTWRPAAAHRRGFNLVYTRMFLRTMKPKALASWRSIPACSTATRCCAARNLYDFDNVFTAPLHGFRDTDDYWTRASAKPRAARHPRPGAGAECAQRSVPARPPPAAAGIARGDARHPAHGGHVGFAAARLPGTHRLAAAPHARFLRRRRSSRLHRERSMRKTLTAAWMTSSNRPWPSGRTCRIATAGWRSMRAATGACATNGAQARRYPATSIANAALLDFINRNYAPDERRPLVFPERPAARLREAGSDAHTLPAPIRRRVSSCIPATADAHREAWLTEARHS